MLACRIHAKEDLRIEDSELPEIGAGQVLIRLGAGGICGSDLHYYYEGRNGSFIIREPLIPGHEASGVVAKIGQDGHDRGQKVIASAFADMGFDVIIGDLFATPDEVAQKAKEADVHIVGVSTMTAGHLTLTPELRDALARVDRQDIMMVVGGVIPPDDFQALYDAGAAAIFPPGTNIPVAAEQLLHELNIRLGFAQREVAKAGLRRTGFETRGGFDA